MACFMEADDREVERMRQDLYDRALDAPGTACFARMEAVRRATDLPQLLALALEWGVTLGGAEDASAAAAAAADAAPRPPSSSSSKLPPSDSPKARRSASSARPAGPAVCASKARRDLEAAKSAAEVIATMESASVDELATCPYDWRTHEPRSPEAVSA